MSKFYKAKQHTIQLLICGLLLLFGSQNSKSASLIVWVQPEGDTAEEGLKEFGKDKWRKRLTAKWPKRMVDYRFHAFSAGFGLIMGSIESITPQIPSADVIYKSTTLGYTLGKPGYRIPIAVGVVSPASAGGKTINKVRVEGGIEIPFLTQKKVNVQRMNLYGTARVVYERFAMRGTLSGESSDYRIRAGSEPLIGRGNSIGLTFGGGVDYLLNASPTTAFHLFLESSAGVISHQQVGAQVLQGLDLRETLRVQLGFRVCKINWIR